MAVDITSEFDIFADQPGLHDLNAALRERGPVLRVPGMDGPAYIVLTNSVLREALKDDDAFPSAAAYSEMMDPAVGRSVMSMSGAEHVRNRGILIPSFRRSAMQLERSKSLEPLCRSLIEQMNGATEIDLVDAYTHKFPMMVITDLIGMPAHEYQTLERWSNQLFAFVIKPESALRARRELTEFLLGVLAERRRCPQDDLVSVLAAADNELSEEEVLSFLRLLFPAGTHNTSNGLGSLLYATLTVPGLQDVLRAQPERRRAAVDEAIRWEPPVANLPRKAGPRGAELGGVQIPPNASMIYSFSAANRDPAVFKNPNEFDLDRSGNRSLTFGFGEHHCLGAWLAREELHVGLDLILDNTTDIQLVDAAAATPVGATLRGPRALPAKIAWK